MTEDGRGVVVELDHVARDSGVLAPVVVPLAAAVVAAKVLIAPGVVGLVRSPVGVDERGPIEPTPCPGGLGVVGVAEVLDQPDPCVPQAAA